MTDPSPPVTIFRTRDPASGLRELLARFDAAGDLILSGWDTGQRTAAVRHEEDYEYWIRVPAAHLPQLLLELLRAWYAHVPDQSSSITRWLDGLDVPYGFSTFSEDAARVTRRGEGAAG